MTRGAIAHGRRRYVTGEYVHQLTRSRFRVLDTMAPDAPLGSAVAPGTGPDGARLRYAVECADHGTGPLFFATLKEAERSVRQSVTWCHDCAELLDARTEVRGRKRPQARGTT